MSKTDIQGDVKSITEMLKDVWQNPLFLEPPELSNISTAASPCEEAIKDLWNPNLSEDACLKIVMRSSLTHYHLEN